MADLSGKAERLDLSRATDRQRMVFIPLPAGSRVHVDDADLATSCAVQHSVQHSKLQQVAATWICSV
jgi:hypothetical protein